MLPLPSGTWTETGGLPDGCRPIFGPARWSNLFYLKLKITSGLVGQGTPKRRRNLTGPSRNLATQAPVQDYDITCANLEEGGYRSSDIAPTRGEPIGQGRTSLGPARTPNPHPVRDSVAVRPECKS
ncbi:hypothetical protein Bbelb_116940 [Branchiostoma belcheri]|nr:hypothetical protein Bbelb_116940 [Branchiostoma belcheri]